MVEVSIVSRFHSEDSDLKDVMSIINYSWVPQILSRLDYYGQLRYNQIKRSLRSVSSTSLSRSLSMLEKSGIVTRTVYDTTPPKVVYALTAKGKELGSIIKGIREVGARWKDKKGRSIEVQRAKNA